MTTRPPPREDPGSLASRLGVSPSAIKAWQRALDRRAPRTPGRQALGLGFVALALATLLWSRPAATAGCPDPSPALPANLTKFCPDTPAYAEDINQNFAQVVAWIEKFAGPVGQGIPTGWIKTANISPASDLDGGINGGHLQDGAVLGSHIKDGTITKAHVAPGTLPKSKVDATGAVVLRSTNVACSPFGHDLTLAPTCIAARCATGVDCTLPQVRYYGCDTTTCGACGVPAPISCNNAVVGSLLK